MYSDPADWRAPTVSAVEAELERQYPAKPKWQREQAANRFVAELARLDYSLLQGPAAALLDVLTFCRTISAPLPPISHSYIDTLTCDALAGKLPENGTGRNNSLEVHRLALVKRLRWALVQEILDTDSNYKTDDARMLADGACLKLGVDRVAYEAWMTERAKATGEVTRACTMALEKTPNGQMLTWQAIYSSWQEVHHARQAHDDDPFNPWPGHYYVPTLETMERLGWHDLTRLVTWYGGPDFPDLGMV